MVGWMGLGFHFPGARSVSRQIFGGLVGLGSHAGVWATPKRDVRWCLCGAAAAPRNKGFSLWLSLSHSRTAPGAGAVATVEAGG